MDGVQVVELSRLARTVRAWEAEILTFHAPPVAPTDPIEAVNLLLKRVECVGAASAASPTTGLRLLL